MGGRWLPAFKVNMNIPHGMFLESLLGATFRVDTHVIFWSVCLMPLTASAFVYSMLVALGTPKIEQERKL